MESGREGDIILFFDKIRLVCTVISEYLQGVFIGLSFRAGLIGIRPVLLYFELSRISISSGGVYYHQHLSVLIIRDKEEFI